MGSPSGNWFPWLAGELRSLGHEVVVPEYPTPNNQSLESWLEVFDQDFGLENLNEDSILIGHSLGATFILKLLERAKQPIAACYLVAGFTRKARS